ncbi:uncharacterized protein LOC117345235 [Pecten maximus]|uniref:uncharacterized protein LOC117345235 n=1 Tax=Pecten maximus TaxID=6579 RepID=UPI0014588642|nr:uncharacterized protein LOC117345235 [Pecten maximus]
MTYDLPSVSYMALYIVSMHIVSSNSRSSTGANHWRLNADEGKVVQAEESENDGFLEDGLMTILTRKVTENGEWRVEDEQKQIPCDRITDRTVSSPIENKPPPEKKKLTCGKPVNYTQYDHLRGIANRNEHSHIPEPEVAMMFRRKGSKTSEIDMTELEERLKKSKKEKPKSVQTHSQIGNFWRIKGNSLFAIECFRKALSISPNNPEVLLYLARVLFNLQYLDDAIFLTRRSLVMQQPNSENSWLQHYTLGEILKAYGHYQEATLHFRHALDLNPGYQPAEAHLREMDGAPNPSVTQYTLFIILFLVLGVIFGVITSIEANFEDSSEVKTQRHFNRAMAMRSIKLGINPRLIRMRKMNC